MLSLGAMKAWFIITYVWFLIGALYIGIPAVKEFVSAIFGSKK